MPIANMSFVCEGSSHSDKEVDPNTPEKVVPRTPTERKQRKRKAEDSGGNPQGPKGVRNQPNQDKKINDYFKQHSGGNSHSPIRHGGAKSPSPQQPYPMVRILFINLK